MKKISILMPARGQVDKFIRWMTSIENTTTDPNSIEVLVAIDDNDPIFLAEYRGLEDRYKPFNLKFHITKQSEHLTKDYTNFLAFKATGRWMFPSACDHQIMTQGWDKTLYKSMDYRSKITKDDIIHGLIKDNIKRDGEDLLYPNFSCHCVQSKEHVDAIGYFFDERNWSWGSDHAVSWVYRALEKITGEKRIVSLTSIYIISPDSIHTTKETDPIKLEAMRQADKGYQKWLRVSKEHPCQLTTEDYANEALKLREYIRQKRGKKWKNQK